MDIRTGLNPDGYWYAIDDSTYDCDCDQDGYFSTSPVGYGMTQADAIADLKEQVEENAE
jgi:hypothetical protein